MFSTDCLESHCPCCGEPIELVVDLSESEQEYIEDCQVCCRPILVNLSVGCESVSLVLRSEDQGIGGV